MKFKTYIFKIFVPIILAVVVLGMSTHTAHAADTILGALWDFGAGAVVLPIANAVIGGIAAFLMALAGFGLSLTGTLLNVSMFLTTHLGMFMDHTPAIYTVWGIIRDLSSILLIFFILYAAILMIIGMRPADYGGMIKNIIIVGVLINFSFFFTRVMIDASNIVSLQFYDAIAPSNTASSIGDREMEQGIPAITKILLTSGGVSNAIMGQLNVTGWWSKSASSVGASNATASGSASDGLNLVLVAVGGIVVSTITILSFVAIAAAAILRIAMLIFLIAFSPVWVASWAMPQLKELTKQWTQNFYAQLIFLPVYLAFLYVALRIITELHLNKVTTVVGTADFGNAINLFVGFGICIVMLTIPMIAAIGVTKAVGGDSGMIEKWGKGATGWASSRLTSYAKAMPKNAWMYSGGRAASAIARSEGFKDVASRAGLVGGIGRMALKGTRGVAGDYNKKLDSQVKSRTDFAESLGYDERKVAKMEKDLRKQKADKASFMSLAAAATAQGNTGQAAVYEAYANALKPSINSMESAIDNKKIERQASYSQDLGSWGPLSAAQTLWTKVARKDKVAAAQIGTKVWEKQLTSKKDDLKEVKADIKQIEHDIQRRAPARPGQPPPPPTAAELAALSKLKARESELTSNPGHGGDITKMGINDLQDYIAEAKLTR